MASLIGHALDHREQLARRGDCPDERGRASSSHAGDESRRQRMELIPIGRRNPEHARDHREGERNGEIGHEVNRVAPGETGQQFVDDPLYVL